MKLFFAVLLAIGVVLAGVQSREVNGRIIGGNDAQEGAYPYQISITIEGNHFCSGAIIDESTVLTAAHCMEFFTLEMGIKILAGTNQVTSGEEYAVVDIRIHSDFISGIEGDDIAILKVEPITFTDKIQPIELETTFLGGGVDSVVTGWGYINMNLEFPTTLQELHVKTITTEDCKDGLSTSMYPFVVTDNSICTFSKFGEGGCVGDSGGPLAANNKLIGLVSGGEPCGVGFPDIYPRISAYSDWIAENRY